MSDFHLLWTVPKSRLDNTPETGLLKFEYILNFAHKHNAAIVGAGDLSDKPRNWYLLARMMALLNMYKVPFYEVFGQHDTYMYSEITRQSTTLGVLELAGLVTILGEKPVKLSGGIDLYGVNWGQEIPKIEDSTKINILSIHAPIAEQALFPNHNYMDSTKFFNMHREFKIIICGDIHKKFNIGRNGHYILNTGCIIRKTADIYNFTYSPCFYYWDSQTMREEIIPHDPAGQVLSREHIENEQETDRMLLQFINSVSEAEAESVDFKSNISKYLLDNAISDNIKNILFSIMEEE